MEHAAWRSQLDVNEARASAYVSAATAYGELGLADAQALDAFIRDLDKARRDFLRELADDGRRRDA
ncbi:hypothetical protein D9M68_647750 [compost metagenome]